MQTLTSHPHARTQASVFAIQKFDQQTKVRHSLYDYTSVHRVLKI